MGNNISNELVHEILLIIGAIFIGSSLTVIPISFLGTIFLGIFFILLAILARYAK